MNSKQNNDDDDNNKRMMIIIITMNIINSKTMYTKSKIDMKHMLPKYWNKAKNEKKKIDKSINKIEKRC